MDTERLNIFKSNREKTIFKKEDTAYLKKVKKLFFS